MSRPIRIPRSLEGALLRTGLEKEHHDNKLQRDILRITSYSHLRGISVGLDSEYCTGHGARSVFPLPFA
jgi:hypothetical protein